MTKMLHPVAGVLAILTIATFWLSTALSELFASETTVVAVIAAGRSPTVLWRMMPRVGLLASISDWTRT